MDNDLHGHVNNVVDTSYFDCVINRSLIDHGGLDIQARRVIDISPATSAVSTGRSPMPIASRRVAATLWRRLATRVGTGIASGTDSVAA